MVAVSLKKFFFQAEDGIRDVERSRGLGDVYKRQKHTIIHKTHILYRFHNKKQYECREATKDIECYEQQVIVNVAKRHSIAM